MIPWSSPSPCSSSPAHARWRSRSRPCRSWHRGPCSARASFSMLATPTSARADTGTSVIAFAYDGRSALLTVRQTLRLDAAAVVAALKDLKLEALILSGDRAEAVAPVADALGIASWRAALKPADKIAFI